MRKILSKTTIVCILTMLISACAVNPPGESIASLGAGSDAAKMNATRGRADAQMTKKQAQQYALQQEMVSREMDLEQKKRNQTSQNTKNTIDTIGSIFRIFR
ncbi:hypothetical protein AwWohl_02130 [Gammaproteobacteria bacterium]|nr:hypothetical protein AwWohl_02130 [Gammaproteobacteria bacterium]